jgi:methylenetetrahydrofolate--tRNA-(uracil-5-)-methyltransferase
MPIEVMAERGPETLRHGPMKPVGLDDPRTGRWPYAVVQLRQDNKLGTLWNMVGFQTKLKHGEQVRIFRTIPGLENAEFARLGGIHRNSFINSPRLLDGELRLKSKPNIRFAGQITGCEGYVESAAVGILAARFAAAELRGERLPLPPVETAIGALLAHVTGGADAETFQPMNVNFGLMPPLSGRFKRADRKKAYTDRAREKLAEWLAVVRHPGLEPGPACSYWRREEGGCRVKPGMTVLAARLRAACNDTGAAGDAKVDKPDNTSVLNPLLARAPKQVTMRCEKRRRVIADLKA